MSFRPSSIPGLEFTPSAEHFIPGARQKFAQQNTASVPASGSAQVALSFPLPALKFGDALLFDWLSAFLLPQDGSGELELTDAYFAIQDVSSTDNLVALAYPAITTLFPINGQSLFSGGRAQILATDLTGVLSALGVSASFPYACQVVVAASMKNNDSVNAHSFKVRAAFALRILSGLVE